ncbi:MAG: hypothetical protein V4613_01265 [Bacteroidota bacterium]
MEDFSKKLIVEIWDNHVLANEIKIDENGVTMNNIDSNRLDSIEVIKVIIRDFLNQDIALQEFKGAMDMINRHHNLWNFSAKMGQMYFNQLLKSGENDIDQLATLLKKVISEPADLKDALQKIAELEKYTNAIYAKAEDKRKVPYPGSVGYFLSYFWQVHDNKKWPIMYSSLINAFRELGLWKELKTQKENYEQFFTSNNIIRDLIKESKGIEVSNWDIEHVYWNYKYSTPFTISTGSSFTSENFYVPKMEDANSQATAVKQQEYQSVPVVATFDLNDYLIPKVSRLLNITENEEQESTQETYRNIVIESFRQLDFEAEILQQNKRKNPYAIIKSREENVAFIIDANTSSKGYFENTDDRALKESINDYCKELRREGYKKVGFILVSHHFESNNEPFINYINWHTDIKKLLLLSSEALLYLLAYKNKDKLRLEMVIENLAKLNYLANAKDIIEEFEPQVLELTA